ncbi:MAG: TIGR03986 family CRISPR-associated RAMP protein, partial [Zetaproteobacteria bacterium]
MIRNVLEIVAFGRMRFVDDRVMSLRDLTGPVKEQYRQRLAESKVQAGWLAFEDGRWRITPCSYVRVPIELLERHFGLNEGDLRRREPASRRYRKIGGRPQKVRFTCKNGKAVALGKGEHKGWVVLTGHPGGRKSHDFIFYDERPEAAFPLEEKEMRAFLQVHADERPENAWNMWKGRVRRGARVPVFFIKDKQQGVQLGLARMFRLPYRCSVHDAIGHTQSEHVANRGTDLPALIFGFADTEHGTASRKGRAWFTPAFAEGNPKPLRCDPTVLATPKPSYFPNYLVQETDPRHPGRLASSEYQTWMSENCEIRGFKRYPARNGEEIKPFPVPEGVRNNKKVQVVLHPLPKGTKFKGKLIFHNLKPEELGALVWALTWGGNGKLRHAIGMGRPFGFGQLTIRIANAELRPNDPKQTIADGLRYCEACMQRFEAMMDGFAQASLGTPWKRTPQ